MGPAIYPALARRRWRVDDDHGLNCLVQSGSADVSAVNDNGGAGGFEFRAVKYYQQSRPGALAVDVAKDSPLKSKVSRDA